MSRLARSALAPFCLLLASVGLAGAQPHEALGTRALGMGGAFTAVADDATAVYWNPAGIATGDYVSVVVERQGREAGLADEDPSAPALRGDATVLALSVPVISLAYYRLEDSWLGPVREVERLGLRQRSRDGGSLVTNHFALALAQTITEGLHVGVALKAVRGAGVTGRFDAPLDGRPWPMSARDGLDVLSESHQSADISFDADLGVMLDARRWRLGFTARNLREPEFASGVPDQPIRLERTARVGLTALPTHRLVLAIDADLTTGERADGRWRALAMGAEGWSATRRWGVRGGVRVQTVDEARPAATVGATAAVWKLLLADAQAGIGADGRREWSIGARVSY